MFKIVYAVALCSTQENLGNTKETKMKMCNESAKIKLRFVFHFGFLLLF